MSEDRLDLRIAALEAEIAQIKRGAADAAARAIGLAIKADSDTAHQWHEAITCAIHETAAMMGDQADAHSRADAAARLFMARMFGAVWKFGLD